MYFVLNMLPYRVYRVIAVMAKTDNATGLWDFVDAIDQI